MKLVSMDSDSEGVDLGFLHLWSLWQKDAKSELTKTTREKIHDLNWTLIEASWDLKECTLVEFCG